RWSSIGPKLKSIPLILSTPSLSLNNPREPLINLLAEILYMVIAATYDKVRINGIERD
ncbi:MAG: hypothetical protein ACI8UZ_001497, partial [Akkermansiaceae bacterium]